ncbi:MAG: hypothetical protein ACE5EE_02210 [Fidelibacterota bacterium]
MEYTLKWSLIILVSISHCAIAEDNGAGTDDSGLMEETLLHPLDTFTAYTLKKGEWAYNQALAPWPTWAWWGITDRVTTEIDIEAWLGGVPSLNFRLAISDQTESRPALAYETMFQWIYKEIDLLESSDFGYLHVLRKGTSWYHRINATWYLMSHFRAHLSAGFTYSESLTLENSNRSHYKGKHYQDLVSPDLSVGIGWRLRPWISFHSSLSYGSTFLYLDNVPRKYQFTYGFRLKPFRNSERRILRTFHVELASVNFYFREANELVYLPIPIYPFFYWQWGG